jgi:osmotically-inducible protein OsmY
MVFGSPRKRLVTGVLIAATELLGSLACRDTQEPPRTVQTTQPLRAEQPAKSIDLSTPETAMDRGIREELRSAIEQDPALKDCEISFSVDNGDVTVTGNVRSETERRRMNDLAMHVSGVKSVANALRVSPS